MNESSFFPERRSKEQILRMFQEMLDSITDGEAFQYFMKEVEDSYRDAIGVQIQLEDLLHFQRLCKEDVVK